VVWVGSNGTNLGDEEASLILIVWDVGSWHGPQNYRENRVEEHKEWLGCFPLLSCM
jgi:hypothetical protein